MQYVQIWCISYFSWQESSDSAETPHWRQVHVHSIEITSDTCEPISDLEKDVKLFCHWKFVINKATFEAK